MSVRVQRKVATALAGALLLAPLGAMAAGLYYPHAKPSSWYVLPGQTLGFSGTRFAPGAQVTIVGGGGTLSAVADSAGAFSVAPFTVPYKWQSSRQTFSVSAPGSAYSIPLTITVGTFYPVLTPSTYYAELGQSMSASARGMAAGEPVMFMVNGALVGQVAADSAGRASLSFSAPASSGTFVLMAQGSYSGVFTSRIIALHL